MPQITYRSRSDRIGILGQPQSADEAISLLNDGNRRFASLSPEPRASGDDGGEPLVIDVDFGSESAPGAVPDQRPFAVVLGCSDARVPIELVFGRGVNDLFVVRMAGNTIGSDGIGSIDYALHHFPSVKAAVVLGHSCCGAVAAAVDAVRRPRAFLDLASTLPLRSLVDRILAGVRGSATALERVHGAAVVNEPGYEAALLEVSVGLNAAYTAYTLNAELWRQSRTGVQVVWGVYDLASRRVGVPGAEAGGLTPPPSDADSFRSLATSLAGTSIVRELLTGGESKGEPVEGHGDEDAAT